MHLKHPFEATFIDNHELRQNNISIMTCQTILQSLWMLHRFHDALIEMGKHPPSPFPVNEQKMHF